MTSCSPESLLSKISETKKKKNDYLNNYNVTMNKINSKERNFPKPIVKKMHDRQKNENI